MIPRFAVFTLVVLAVSAGLWFLFEATYDAHRFASAEARDSVQVTESQTADLLASARKSNMIAYAIFGGVIAAVSGFLCHPSAKTSGRLRAAIIGVAVGGLAGVAMAWLGHWFDGRIKLPPDPMIYWVERWALMLLPICLAVALAIASAGQFKRNILESVVGALIGGAAATVIYCIVSGTFTPIEGHHHIYPASASNRLLILTLSAVFVGGVALLQLGRSRSKSASESQAS